MTMPTQGRVCNLSAKTSYGEQNFKFIALAILEIFQGEIKILMGHVTITTPLSGIICRLCAGTSYVSAVYQIYNLYVHSLQRYYERRRKMQKFVWFWGQGSLKVIGNIAIQQSTTSYSTLIETMHLSCTVYELLSLISQKLKMSHDHDHVHSRDLSLIHI